MDKFCLTGPSATVSPSAIANSVACSTSTSSRHWQQASRSRLRQLPKPSSQTLRAAGLQACAFALAWQHHGTRLLAAMHSWRLRQAHGDIGAKFTHGNEEDPTISTCIALPCGPCLLFFLATMALGLLELGGFDYAPHTAIATAEARCHEQTDRNLTCRSIVNLHDGTQLLSSLTEGAPTAPAKCRPKVRDDHRAASTSLRRSKC